MSTVTERLKEIEAERQQLLAQTQADRDAYKALVEERVPEVVKALMNLEAILILSKADAFNAFRDIIQLKQEVYGVKDQQQSHTFTSGDYSIELGYRVLAGWDDTVNIGVSKVKTFITSQVNDEKTKHLVSGILKLLKTDKQGNLNPSRVMEMKKLAEEWGDVELMDGVDIIMKAHKPQKSNWYITARKPDAISGSKVIGLSIQSVGFPEGFEFSFVNAIPDNDGTNH